MAIDSFRKKKTNMDFISDIKSDIKEKNYLKNESDTLIDDGYLIWLKIGGLQHSANNYKQYLEYLKNGIKKNDKYNKESLEEAKKKIEDTKKMGEELLAMLEQAIERESEKEKTEEKRTFRH